MPRGNASAVAGTLAMSSDRLKHAATSLVLYGMILVAGAFFALVVHQMVDALSARHLIAICLVVVMIAGSALFLPRYPDFLLVIFFLGIPFTGFIKSLFLTTGGFDEDNIGILLYSGAIGIGPMDLVIVGLYVTWFVRIFIARSAPLPRFQRADLWVLLLPLVYIASIAGTPDPQIAIFALFYLMRFVAVYFYVSRNFERRHIEWMLAAILVLILFEGLLAMFQYSTGKLVGLALDRGAGVRLNEQYSVPGIEHRHRATGTAYESHTFGIYMAMLAQFAFVLTASTFHRRGLQMVAGAMFALALLAVLLSFSRSAWLSCAIALFIAWCVHLLVWRERAVLAPTAFILILMLIASPFAVGIIYERFSSTGGELVLERFYQYPVAWNIWSDHFFFGYGVANYMEALKTYNEPGAAALPVHNVFLWIGAESGLFGVIVFYGLAFSALWRTWKLIRSPDVRISRVALAVFCALAAYLLDGLTNPLYREPVIYMMFWVLIALSIALSRIDTGARQQANGARNPP